MQQSVLSFHYVGSGDQIQVIRPSGKCLHSNVSLCISGPAVRVLKYQSICLYVMDSESGLIRPSLNHLLPDTLEHCSSVSFEVSYGHGICLRKFSSKSNVRQSESFKRQHRIVILSPLDL